MSASPVSVGTRIADRYVVLGELGAGGMGVVVKARDERLGREVAMKVLPAETIGDQQARRRLVREARAAAGLEHPAIVHVYDVGETSDGGTFLVMELVKGKSLRDHLVAGTLSVATRIAALVDVGRAVAFAHDRGFVHRDIKPDNVMIRDDGRAVVLDFGLAKAHAEVAPEAATLTAKGSFVGTPAYMAPEQARAEDLDGRADQFALAVTLFEAVSGALPWRGKGVLEIVGEILHAAPRSLAEVRPELPPALGDVIARGLAKAPADRFATMTEFIDAVERAASPVSTASAPQAVATGAAHASTVAASVSSAVATAPRTAQWPARRALVAALVAAGAAIMAAALLRRGGEARSTAGEGAVASPLVTPTGTLACPIFAATAHDFASAGWLGAAAAHLVCERAAIALGGPSRSLVPAELLALPRGPAEDFPGGPFDAPGARDRSMSAARASDAWVDGSVERSPDGFHVALVLRSKDDAEAGRGEGTGATLLRAVATAMTPLIKSGALPSDEGSPWLKTWTPGTSVGGAMALHDLHVAVVDEDPEGIREACDSLKDRNDVGSALGAFASALCADRLGEAMPPPPPLDTSSPASLATGASIARLYPAHGDDDRARLASIARALEEAGSREQSAYGRALLTATAAEVLYALAEGDDASRLALLSISASPREVDVRGTAWHRLGFTSRDRLGVLDPYAAWLPWQPFAQANTGRIKADNGSTREGAHRAAALAGGGYWVIYYGEQLINTGDMVGASAVAAVAHSASLTVKVLRAEGRLRGALDAGIEALAKISAGSSESMEAARLAADTAQLAAILERPSPQVQEFYDRFLVPDPPPFSKGVIPFFSALSACVQAPRPTSVRCVSRLGELFRAGHFGAAYIGSAEAMAGAEKYVAGDLAGATRAWRPILLRSVLTMELMRDSIAGAYDRVGDPAFAARVDAPALEEGARMSLAVVRAAQRAEKAGDCAGAVRYATRVIDKWEPADEKPPCVDRMKKLVLRCSGHH